MSDLQADVDAFEELQKLLADYADKTEDVLEILEAGAKEFVADVRKLPSPRSKIRKSGYTHLLNSVTYRKRNGEIEAGWGKFYGPVVEYRGKRHLGGGGNGKGTPHFVPTFQKNKEKYYNAMLKKGGLL